MGRRKGVEKTPGSGKKKGFKSGATLDKLMARELVRQMVVAKLGPLVESQIANATGLKYLVARDRKSGKFLRIGAALASEVDAETIEVWEKEPSVQAFTDLLNRALDKPAEQKFGVEVSGPGGAPLMVRWATADDAPVSSSTDGE